MSIRTPIACALALALVACGDNSLKAAPPGTARIHCVNPANNYAWNIAVDEAGRKIDGHPATFQGPLIDWTDPSDGSNVEFDRSSGKLTITRASSTGGAMNFYACAAAH
jgi:hypothetical protein